MRRKFDDASPWFYGPEQSNITVSSANAAYNWATLFNPPVVVPDAVVGPLGNDRAWTIQDNDAANFCGLYTQTPSMPINVNDVWRIQAYTKDQDATSFAVLRMQFGALLCDLAIAANNANITGGNQANSLVVAGSNTAVGNGWFLVSYDILSGIAGVGNIITAFFPAAGTSFPSPYVATAVGTWALRGMNIRRVFRG